MKKKEAEDLKYGLISIILIGILIAGCAGKGPETPAPPAVVPTTPAPTTPMPTTPTPTTPAPTTPKPTTPAPTVKPTAAGEKLFEAKGCYECHTIVGVGYAVGPVLDGYVKAQISKQGEAEYKAWLFKFLSDPPGTKLGTPKPKLAKPPTQEEFDKIFEFLKGV